MTIRDFFRTFSSAVDLTQTGSYDAQIQPARDLLQLPIKVCDWIHIRSVHHPGSQPVCRITQGAGSLPCALRITASRNMRSHILFVLTIEIASYSHDLEKSACKECLWNRGKPVGATHAKTECLDSDLWVLRHPVNGNTSFQPVCSTVAGRDLHPLDSFKKFHRFIFSSSSSRLFPAR